MSDADLWAEFDVPWWTYPPIGRPCVMLRWAFRHVGRGSELGGDRTVVPWKFWPDDTPALAGAKTSPHIEIWLKP
jgi:hypothetical protein